MFLGPAPQVPLPCRFWIFALPTHLVQMKESPYLYQSLHNSVCFVLFLIFIQLHIHPFSLYLMDASLRTWHYQHSPLFASSCHTCTNRAIFFFFFPSPSPHVKFFSSFFSLVFNMHNVHMYVWLYGGPCRDSP